jgi:hypothetical protein
MVLIMFSSPGRAQAGRVGAGGNSVGQASAGDNTAGRAGLAGASGDAVGRAGLAGAGGNSVGRAGVVGAGGVAAGVVGGHPRLLFGAGDVDAIKGRAGHSRLAPYARRVVERAEWLLTVGPLVPSITRRGEADPPGEQKGLACARKLQGRVIDLAMAFTLTGDRRYRDKVVALLDDAIQNWRIWVDTAHPPPYDLMAGENAMTFGLAYDWLYRDLTPAERQRIREGAERRALQPYLDGATREKPMQWLTAKHNWNPVCNGGATVLALAFEGESALSARVLALSVPAMNLYWNELKDDGGWNEGTGYWTYGHRYGLIAAEALRRTGHAGGAEVFARPGVRHTAAFPIVFNPGPKLSASFGDSNGRANDAIFYLLAREYHDADAVWFQDRAGVRDLHNEDWPQDALTLLWRPIDQPWLPENQPAGRPFKPTIPPVAAFPSIGWGLMAPSQPDPPFFLAFKNGSLAANHTHLDLNHVSIGIGDTLILRDLGSRPYPDDYFGPKRLSYYEITTAGHNTLLIGGPSSKGGGQTPRKEGKLLGPQNGPNFSEFIGIADGAYDVDAPRARRHVLFVDHRYWVLLDEIDTSEPQPIELRFHTYGTITAASGTGAGTIPWTFTEGAALLDVVSPREGGLVGSVEQPAGWIRPVNVLSLKSAPPAATRYAAITVLAPRPAGETKPPSVTATIADARLDVTINRDRVSFGRAADGGWQIVSVVVATKASDTVGQ